ncbi:MAG TPA: S9 family peptidase [Candidatus Sulfotelmatobacter sp.]|nr:S9 family peptidase [Candidatus Sulfotelmatobacter sp.]
MILYHRICSRSLLCAIVLLLSSAASAQNTGPSRAASIFDSMPHAKRISQAVISPDGTHVAYIVQGKLTVASVENGSSQAIGVEGDLPLRSVCWSTDSKQLAFVADLTGTAPSAQVWTATLGAGSPSPRAELKGYVDAPSFSPDGSKLAVLFIEGMPRSAGPLQPMTPLSGVVGEKIYEQRLATIDLATNSVAQVTPPDMYVYDYDWTPDSHAWVATAAHGSGDANWYVARLYRIDARSGEMKEMYAPKWQIAEPRVSPDGKNVAFIEGLMSDEGSTGGDIFVVPIEGGPARNITPEIKSSPSSLTWTAPDRITFAEYIDGKSGFGTVSMAGGNVNTIWTGDEFMGTTASPSASFSRNGAMTAVVRQSPSTPPEVWAGEIGIWKQITILNKDIQPAWGNSHTYHWTNGSLRLQGWLMFPKNYDAAKQYPLVVNVHGGPSSACGARWDPRMMGAQSALGYFAFCPNPRGSYGEGEAFTRANMKDFGGGDFRDIMAGIDAILQEYPVDPHRLGIRGHSYGGYMTMWVETQTHRFAAAVAGAGLSDWLSYYGVNEIDEWMIPFFGASIYDDPAVYAKSDPMHFVKNVQTPTLILVGDSDGEVPMEQSVEWYHALKALKVPAELVVYPHEGHVFVNPADWRDYFVRGLEWFDEWFAKAQAGGK